MGEVAAVWEVQTHNAVVRVQDGRVDSKVGRRAYERRQHGQRNSAVLQNFFKGGKVKSQDVRGQD